MIRPIGFVDTWAFSSALFAKYKDRFGGEHHSAQILPLRSRDAALPILAEWKSAKALLTRLRAAAAQGFDGRTPEIGEASVVQMIGGGHVEWSADDARGPHAHICIVPAPGAWVFSGGDSSVLPPGQLTLVDHRQLWSAANFGEYPAIHLIAELYLADDQVDDSESTHS